MNLERQERITRKVTEIGNGAHIFAPKEWIDEEVILIRIPRKDIKEEIIKLVYPYLDKIIGVYLFGSYARNEQTESSDVDVLIIASEKFKIEKKGFEIIVLEKDKIEKAIKLNPLLMHSILNESKPVINSSLLTELANRKISINSLNEFITSTKENIRMNIEMLKLEETEELGSNSVIYSLILRLRGVFLIKKLLKKEKYSNESFKKWIINNIPDVDYENVYNVYRFIRDNKPGKIKIKIKDVKSLIILLEKEIKKLKNAK